MGQLFKQLQIDATLLPAGKCSAQDHVYATQQRRDSLSKEENLCPVSMFHLDIICHEAKKCLVSSHVRVVLPPSPALGKSENRTGPDVDGKHDFPMLSI